MIDDGFIRPMLKYEAEKEDNRRENINTTVITKSLLKCEVSGLKIFSVNGVDYQYCRQFL
jgi:hypothetical protein